MLGDDDEHAATAVGVELPAWAQVTEKRREHIAASTALLDEWARRARVCRRTSASRGTTRVCYHDALRDAPEDELRELAGDCRRYEVEMLHGPPRRELLDATARRAPSVLDAIRYHTVGSPRLGSHRARAVHGRLPRAGPQVLARDRAFLAAQVPHDFDGVFRQVVRARLEWSLREGHALFPETVALWNAVR